MNNPSSWNKDILVIDLWIGKVYNLHEFNRYGAGVPIDGISIYSAPSDGYDINYDLTRDDYNTVNSLLK